jgi:hypothetical protein
MNRCCRSVPQEGDTISVEPWLRTATPEVRCLQTYSAIRFVVSFVIVTVTLLGGTLNALSMGMTVLVILVHGASGPAECT